MKYMHRVLFYSGLLFFFSCRQAGKLPAAHQVSKADSVKINTDNLKRTAMDGDLIVRLGDDLLSYQIKFINETDQSYSHAGIIVVKENQKLVAHIAPDDPGKDGIQYIPIDSFAAPSRNLGCALYRYNFSPDEKKMFLQTIDSFKKHHIRFDRKYDLTTNDRMYCSEMISKALAIATTKRIDCRVIPIPKRVLPLLLNYFKGQSPKDIIAKRQIMTVDNLYLNPDCKLTGRFTLKYLPGE